MAEKKSGFKKLFSKSNKDCCSVEIEEVNSEDDNCCDETTEDIDKQQKDA